ncbi:adenosylmethionine decarboxylase [Glaesserella parasuis]|uniref:adenosylmethionine decarboxylase n=1 Tax=Glaesserella parasuis TaxID=738 RepID=UPI000EB751CE|nr:adenosylmethionine decarboxylase [Glaesserella parasuis]ATW44470.1 S-adenosylmethionine decarboxylase proenzyme [Glaesserella parasuis D74]MDE4015502.1 adenosylmethionine decarboxylase [Glaesserella parasuis]MDO9834532.1 adenosylmethionine decarboxylase [Glaesserella parasuis]MDP0318623.1 adenosylmethionine decarboxylase [Glaesserella parasuis]
MEDRGYHYVMDIVINDPYFLKDENGLKTLFLDVLNKTRFNIIDFISYKFVSDGEGVTGVFLLSESHLAYHTYPESNYISIDIYTCGGNCLDAVKEIESCFHSAESIVLRYIERGSDISKLDVIELVNNR